MRGVACRHVARWVALATWNACAAIWELENDLVRDRRLYLDVQVVLRRYYSFWITGVGKIAPRQRTMRSCDVWNTVGVNSMKVSA